MGTCAFAGCRKLSKVEFSEGLKVIKRTAFGNTLLETVNIPSSVEEIGVNAFAGVIGRNPTLKNVILNEGLKKDWKFCV